MSSIARLIVGLGNPGEEYARTRHNVGFMAVDAVAGKYGCAAWKKKFRGLIAGAESFLLLKPQTFMNLSGESAVEALNFYKLTPEDVVVFHDDIDLLPGQIKIKQGGGAGGHNGLKSLDAHIGANYWRVRIGIGRPESRTCAVAEQSRAYKEDAVTNYVLNSFAKSDKAWLDPLLEEAASEFDLLLAGKYADYARTLQKA